MRSLNHRHNIKVGEPPQFINGQGLAPIRSYRLGLFNMAYCGCPAIAIYNAQRLCGKKPDLFRIGALVEVYALTLFGVFGASPWRLKWVLGRLGMENETVKDVDSFWRALDGNIAILCYKTGLKWNSTWHFVAIDGRERPMLIYNRYNDLDRPSPINNIDELITPKQFITAYVFKDGSALQEA